MIDIELEIVEVNHDSKELFEFLYANKDDIELYFPHFDLEDLRMSSCLVIYFGKEIVGILVSESKGQELHLHLDYLIEKYRDQGIGKQVLENQINNYKARGYKRIIALTDNKLHIEYLLSLGFEKGTEHDFRFVYKIR